MPGRFPIVQFPNADLITAAAAAAIARNASGETARGAEFVSRVALLVWAAGELLDGANWFRRLLGAGAAAYALGLPNRPRMEA
jgi:hypothetical protein